GGDAVVAPDGGFTNNTSEIIEAASALTIPLPCSQDGCRRTGQALQLASSLITGDLLATPLGPRSRPTYLLLVIQDGPSHGRSLCPDAIGPNETMWPLCTEPCTTDQVLGQRVEDLRNFVLDNGGADLQLHTLDLAQLDADPNCRDNAELELELMGFRGTGEYRQ